MPTRAEFQELIDKCTWTLTSRSGVDGYEVKSKVNDNTIPYSSQVTLLAFLAAYMLLCLFTYFIMILAGVDSTNSITISLSCASNVGPTLGLEIGPTMSWGILPDLVKWMLSILMLMGRLEIFTVLVLFTRSYWKEN